MAFARQVYAVLAKDLLVDALREYLPALQEEKGERIDGEAARGSIEVTIEAA